MEKIKGAIVFVFTVITASLGALATPLYLLIGCNVIDYATGLAAAPYRGQERSSYKGIRGITKKISMWLLVGVGVIIDMLLGYLAGGLGWEIPFSFAIGCLVCVWLLTNELISIIENIYDMGVNVPPFLLPLIKWVKETAESKAPKE